MTNCRLLHCLVYWHTFSGTNHAFFCHLMYCCLLTRFLNNRRELMRWPFQSKSQLRLLQWATCASFFWRSWIRNSNGPTSFPVGMRAWSGQVERSRKEPSGAEMSRVEPTERLARGMRGPYIRFDAMFQPADKTRAIRPLKNLQKNGKLLMLRGTHQKKSGGHARFFFRIVACLKW